MTIQTKFPMMAKVRHVIDPNVVGMITAFMLRGKNHSYEVQWDVSKISWHLEFELFEAVESNPVGFVA